MPRKPRLHVPGGLYHVTLRGNSRRSIFFDADDRQRWELLIAEGLQRYRHRIHAYCWMTNHVHMAIQCHDGPLSRFMNLVASQYARSTNRKLGRSGHFFERRHNAILVQADSYLKELVRYIHLNPIRAGIVDELDAYQWSSHLAYETGDAPSWLTLNWVFSMFGESEIIARGEYIRFMRADCPSATTDRFRRGNDNDCRILGDGGFLASLGSDESQSKSQKSLEELTQEICSKYGIAASVLSSPSRHRKISRIRAEIGLVAIDKGIATNAEVSRHFNRSQSGLSRAIERLRRDSNM